MKNDLDMTIDFDDNNEAGLFDKQLEQTERNTIDELFGRSIQFRNSFFILSIDQRKDAY